MEGSKEHGGGLRGEGLRAFLCPRCLEWDCRYRELHSESSRKDWSQAEKWYYQAIDTMPANGNPHNQLAVLATYTEVRTD